MKRWLVLCSTFLAVQALASAASFSVGDVFASIGGGQVKVYHPDGTFITTLDTTLGGFTTGSTFDQAGNFYVTAFSADKVSKFDAAGNLVNASWATGVSENESIVFDAAGNAYIGNAGATTIRKVNSSGALIHDYTGLASNTDWIDLAADQSTIIYSDEGPTIHRLNATADTALSNFVTIGDTLYAKRIRPNGDVMAAGISGNVYRWNSAGTLVQTYAIGIGQVFALNLDPDGTSFWTGSSGGTAIREINIATGAVEHAWSTTGTLFGLSVLGEVQAGGGGVVTGGGGTTPEPATYALILGGLGLIAWKRKFVA